MVFDMHNKIYFIAIVLSLLLGACQQEPPREEKSLEEIMAEEPLSNSAIIRNPVTAQRPKDTTMVAKITFEETVYDFGTVVVGEKVTHTFKFKNTGKSPLLISNARSTCGCTVPNWPSQPIPPGESGEIKVVFDTKGKLNQQSKPVIITANTYPATTRLMVKGVVTSSKETS